MNAWAWKVFSAVKTELNWNYCTRGYRIEVTYRFEDKRWARSITKTEDMNQSTTLYEVCVSIMSRVCLCVCGLCRPLSSAHYTLLLARCDRFLDRIQLAAAHAHCGWLPHKRTIHCCCCYCYWYSCRHGDFDRVKYILLSLLANIYCNAGSRILKKYGRCLCVGL